MFRVEYDPAARLMTLTVWGFWKLEDVSRFAAAIGAKVVEIRGLPGEEATTNDYRVLVVSPDFPVQANDVADMMTEVMNAGVRNTSGRIAIYVASHLNKMQVERTLVHPQVRAFLSLDEAKGWLAA